MLFIVSSPSEFSPAEGAAVARILCKNAKLEPRKDASISVYFRRFVADFPHFREDAHLRR